jgi:hypothetical protein
MAENVDPTPVEHMISFDSLSFVAAEDSGADLDHYQVRL